MADNSAIEWTDATWNPIRARNLKTGKVGWHCEHATTGCEFCYSEDLNKWIGTGLAFKPGHRKDVEIFLDETMLTLPLRWKKPRMIFVCSMTDLFADFVPDEFIDKMFTVMALAPQHTFQVLTKRASRMRDYFEAILAEEKASGFANEAQHIAPRRFDVIACELMESPCAAGIIEDTGWPLPNVWLGVSAERQQEANERVPLLLDTPAAVRFVSAEPLLGHIAFHALNLHTPTPSDALRGQRCVPDDSAGGFHNEPTAKLDWIIVGGESGRQARPMNPKWAAEIRDWCAASGVTFFFKQWGEYLPVGQSLPGYGKVHGATAVKPGRMKLHYAGTPNQAPKHAFAERGVGFASTTDDRLTFRVGKKAAGRLLDGVEHNGFPTRTESLHGV